MDDKLVFRERLDKEDMLIKFTVPQVKVGTVIEYQYKIVSPLYVKRNRMPIFHNRQISKFTCVFVQF